jgi:predicted nucleic acid-binding protein
MRSFIPVNEYVADTMALVLRLENRRLPKKAKRVFELVEQGECTIFIPSIVFAEIAYLSERKRITATLDKAEDYISTFSHVVQDPMTVDHIKKSFQISDIPELHDRLIAGTAFFRNAMIITNDPLIQNSRFVSTVWG